MKNIFLLTAISVATVGLNSCAPMGPPYTYSSTRVYENGYWVRQPYWVSNAPSGFSSQGSSGYYPAPSSSGFSSQGSSGYYPPSSGGFHSQGTSGFASGGSSGFSSRGSG